MTLSTIEGGRGTVLPGLKIVFPSTTIRIAKYPFTSVTGGHYYSKVLSFGTVRNQASKPGGILPAVEARVRVDDTHGGGLAARTFQRLKAKDDYRGSAATIYLMAPSVAPASWYVRFSGVLTKIAFPAPFVAELTLRTQDDKLSRKSPNGGWAITRAVFPNGAVDAYDTFAPILFGMHDVSRMATSPGMIPLTLVDVPVYRYLVCAGNAKTVHRVYVNGTLVSSGLYTTEYLTRNARDYTIVKFDNAADALSAGVADSSGVAIESAKVTADVTGYEDVGDGTGQAVSNPVTQWKMWLSNFVLGDWKSGAWLSTSSLIDSTTVSGIEFKIGQNGTGSINLGASGSAYSRTQLTGLEITQRLCKSYRLRCAWTPAGTIALGYDDPFVQPYTGTRWRWYRDEMGPLSLIEDDFNLATRTVARSAWSSSEEKYLQSLEVMDVSAPSEMQDALDMVWSAAA